MSNIVFGNHEINRIKYDDYNIQSIYSCGGELVWKPVDYGCIVAFMVDNSGGTYTKDCVKDDCQWLLYHGFKDFDYEYGGVTTHISILGATAKRSITSVTIGDCVSSIEGQIFSGYTNLEEVTLSPSLVKISIGAGSGTFEGCKKLGSINLPNNLALVGSHCFQGCTSLSSVTFNERLGEIDDYAFFRCTSLTSITLPNSLMSIGGYAFQYCSGLTSVSFGSGLEEIKEYGFSHCTNLRSVVLPNTLTTIYDHSFYDCTSLSSVTVGSGVTYVGDNAFQNCSGLTEMTLPATLEELGGQVFSYSNIQSLTLLCTTPPTINSGTFAETPTLTYIYVPCESYPTYKTEWATYGTWLTNKIKPLQGSCPYPTYDFTQYTKWTYKGNNYEFERKATTCPNTTSGVITSNDVRLAPSCLLASNFPTDAYEVTIGDEVNTIQSRAFSNWIGLKNVYISANVNAIYSYAFQYCTSLESITVWALTPPAMYYAFENTNNCPIYVLPTVLDTYKNNSDWSRYRDRLFAIPM